MIALRERLELAYNIVSELTPMKPIDPKLLYDLQLHLNIAIGLLPTEVHAVQDDSCSWYIIPSELKNEFYADDSDDEFVNSGGFQSKWGRYSTCGNLNLTQLYAEL